VESSIADLSEDDLMLRSECRERLEAWAAPFETALRASSG